MSRRFPTTVLTLSSIALVLAACTTGRGLPKEREVVLDGSAPVQGLVVARNITVPAGAIVTVAGPLELRASERIRIDGELVGRDRASDLEPNDAPAIVLRSDGELDVRGVVRGGRGRAFRSPGPRSDEGHRGGNGSSIWLVAPEIRVTGRVVGGDGGTGGAGAPGGDGGDVFVGGRKTIEGMPTRADDPPERHVHLAGGMGGTGGVSTVTHTVGGPGGRGGRVVTDRDVAAFIDPPVIVADRR